MAVFISPGPIGLATATASSSRPASGGRDFVRLTPLPFCAASGRASIDLAAGRRREMKPCVDGVGRGPMPPKPTRPARLGLCESCIPRETSRACWRNCSTEGRGLNSLRAAPPREPEDNCVELDADRQFSVGSGGPPGRRLAARRRRVRPGALVIRQHPARLGLHGARVKHAAFSDVADTGVKRLGDMSRCGAVALLVHRSNPNKAFVRPATLLRPGLGCIVGVLRCYRDGRSQCQAFACVTRIPPLLSQLRLAWDRVPSRGQCGTRQ
jgi:hypothetical protein